MILAGIIFLIAIASIGLAFWSLKGEMRKHHPEQTQVKNELAKGRVIFHSSSASESSE